MASPSKDLTSHWMSEDMNKVVEFMQSADTQRNFQEFLYENGFKHVEACENTRISDDPNRILHRSHQNSLWSNIPKNSNASANYPEN